MPLLISWRPYRDTYSPLRCVSRGKSRPLQKKRGGSTRTSPAISSPAIHMKHLIMTLISTLGLCSGSAADEPIQLLAPKAFITAAQADSTAVILDVRRPSEFAEGHLKGAILLDWLSDKTFLEGLEKLDKERTHYIYCRSGKRSHAAATLMQSRGFKVVEMEGGYLNWVSEGLPVEK